MLEWGVKHPQGIRRCRDERDAKESLEFLIRSWESSQKRSPEPHIVVREVTEWQPIRDGGGNE